MAHIGMFRNDYGLHFRVSFLGLNFQSKLFRDYKLAHTCGIRNRTPDGKFCVFLDMDNTLLEFLIPEMRYLQEKYVLGDLYIFKSSQKEHGYHVMGINKLDFRDWLSLVEESSADEYYRSMPLANDWSSWVLRIEKKAGSDAPKLIRILKSKSDLRPNSLAHALFLKYHHKIDISKIKNLDKNTILFTIHYGTLNYLDIEEEIKKGKAKNANKKDNK